MKSALLTAASHVQTFLARHGIVLISPPWRYGVDPFADIKRLSKEWRSVVTVFFDVGANDGKTARSALKWFPDARVFSFEPHPSTFNTLLKRIGNNIHFQCANVALGTEVSMADLYEYDLSVWNSLKPNAQFAMRFKKEGHPIPVQCTTLDIYCQNNNVNHIDVLKIDTEGFEAEVLHGSRQMIESGLIRFIYLEFNDLRTKAIASGGGLTAIDDFLRPFGYRFVASYNDYIITEGEMFAVSNVLFVLPQVSENIDVPRPPTRDRS